MWKSSKELGREYLDQAEELEKEIARLRRKRPRSLEEKRKLRRKIDILDSMLIDLRKNGDRLLRYYEEREDDGETVHKAVFSCESRN